MLAGLKPRFDRTDWQQRPGEAMTRKPWILREIEKLEDLIRLLGLTIKDLEIENNRLRRELLEVRKQRLELLVPGRRSPLKM